MVSGRTTGAFLKGPPVVAGVSFVPLMNSCHSRRLFSSLLAALLAGTVAHAAEQAASVDELVQQGEVYDRKFQPVEALKYYSVAEKLDPKNPEILLRIARQHRHLMADTTNKNEKLRLGNIALDYSQRAVALMPNDPEANLAIAITLGKMLPYLGTKEQVAASPRIKAAVDKTLRLDPRNDIAWHILGRWQRVLADIGGVKRALAGAFYGKLPKGSNEEAERCLQKAIAINPDRLMHYIELGRVYAQMGRKDEARKYLNKGLAMPNTEKDDPEMKEKGRETLAKIR
jgi:tetratricopeptide (TPR) repeat protein